MKADVYGGDSMGGFGRAAVRALVGALALALCFATPAAADETETAAVTRGPDLLDGGAPLPSILTLEDATRYRAIFGLQEAGQWRAADREITRLQDRRLLGHVLAQRYLHPTKYRSSYSELKAWLAAYADHPDAPRIYRLAMRRKPAGAKAPRPPRGSYYNPAAAAPDPALAPYRSAEKRSAAELRRVRAIKAEIRSRIRRGWPTGAKEVLSRADSRRRLDQVEVDLARADIAASYFYYGKDREALAAAGAATARSSRWTPQAHWAGGLAAWRLGLFDRAAAHFEALGMAERASEWDRAAGAYWAARSHLLARRPERVNVWLGRAAGYAHTFYGLLARRALGLAIELDWRGPRLAQDMLAGIAARPAGGRALALLQVGRRTRAELELRRIHPDGPDAARALLALALRAGLPRLAIGMAGAIEALEGRQIDAGRFPVPIWVPEGGYRIDRALLFALMRQESRFSTRAKSRAGARGVMQLMPRTASFIARDRSLRGAGRYRLYEPAFNIALGQDYLAHLLGHEVVRGSLFGLIAAYNGGPGNLARWQRDTRYAGDPLLFIESIPARETRGFIERVLANLWIYRDRLGQPAPSLDAIAAGDWPVYISLDGTDHAVAQNGTD